MDVDHISRGFDASAFDDAPTEFMRSMLTINGQLFAEMNRGARPRLTLQYLCDAAAELLQADHVTLQLHEDTLGIWGQFSSSGSPMVGVDPVAQIRRDIHSEGNPPLGQLDISWPDKHHDASPLDLAAADHFTAMALIILERHLDKRRQLQAVAQEREALAGEIHDDPVQVMTAVSLQLQRVAGRLPDGEDRSAIQKARSLNDSAIERLRHVMFAMHPTTLVEDGLAASIEAYCESFVETEGLDWQVTSSGETTVPIEVAALGFRLCRNALVNVMEHAEATKVVIAVSCADDYLKVEVRDDGIGFDMAQVRHTKVGHLGIPHAVTIASWVAGSYLTESKLGQGTTVTIELPIL